MQKGYKFLYSLLFFLGMTHTKPTHTMMQNTKITSLCHFLIPTASIILMSSSINRLKKTLKIKEEKGPIFNYFISHVFLFGYWYLMSATGVLGKWIGFSNKNKTRHICLIFIPCNVLFFASICAKNKP